MQNDPWRLAPLPKGKKAIKCNWVYKVKYKPNGKIEKFKARLVAKGYSQVEGIDYSETYAPVIKFDSLRIICAMVTKAQMKMEQFKVCTAFLHGNLVVEIFMKQPLGFRSMKGVFQIGSVFFFRASMVSNSQRGNGRR